MKTKECRTCVPDDVILAACHTSNPSHPANDALRRWPWLKTHIALPCGCKRLKTPNALLVLQHVYDEHVIAQGDRTLAQLADWIVSQAAEAGEPIHMPTAHITKLDKALCPQMGIRW